MALPTIDAVSGGFAGAGSLTWSHTVGAGADVLYAWVQQGRTDFDIDTVTFGGTPMTKQGSTVTDGNSRLSLWRLTGPTPSTANIVATMEFSASAQIRGIGVSMADVDTATYNDTAVTATAALAVGDTITSDQMFLVGFGYFDAEGPLTQTIGVSGTAQTLQRQEMDAFGTTGLGVSSQTGSGSVTSTFTYNHTAEGRSLLGIAVNGVVPVGPTITVQPAADVVLINGDPARASAAFSVTATGTGSLSYDWELETSVGGGVYANLANGDGATWSGQTAASCSATFTAKTLTGRRVRCNVTDDNGTTTSDAVVLTVYNGPTISKTSGTTNGSGVDTLTISSDYPNGDGEFTTVTATAGGITKTVALDYQP